jgi:cyclic-di-AMP phosphodiesterase PgpH
MNKLIHLLTSRFSLVLLNRSMRNFFLLSFLIIVVATALLSINRIGETYDYKIGDIAHDNILVPDEMIYTIDYETEIERRFAAERIPPVIEKDPYILAEKMKFINILFNSVETVLTSRSSSSKDDQLVMLLDMLPDQLKYDKKIIYSIISYARVGELRKILISVINEIYEKGVVDETQIDSQISDESMVSVVTSIYDRTANEEKRHFGDIYTLKSLKTSLQNICLRFTSELPKDQQLTVYVITKSMIRPNLRYNMEETKKRMEDASQNVKPVKGMLRKGEVIVRHGDPVTADIYRKILVINERSQSIHVNYIIGIFLLQFIFYLIFIVYVSPNYHKLVTDQKASLIITILLVAFMLYTFFMKRSISDQDSQVIFALLLPIPFISMMISILYNTPLAIITAFFSLFFTISLNASGINNISSSIKNADFASLGIAISSTLLSIFGTRDLERRTDFLRRGLIIGIVNSCVAVTLALADEYSAGTIIKNIQYALVGGIINSVMVIGLFPVFEHLFDITTVFKLYELSDLNAAIFKRMLIRAPGTYNHSIMVANLAESACRQIGADFLLARVGGYYHDIGKIENAQIFIENKQNPNEPISIPPQDYSQLIISHVEKGVELARKNNIPQSVINFIREHHGDSMMTFFYHQALELAQESGETDLIHRSYFQYPGPKPHSKESAVVMLADSVEAASRSLHEPSYVKLESLVKKIISSKLGEGDLEHSDLTMEDLTSIQKSFLQVLNGIFHTRLEYPQAEIIKQLEAKVGHNADHH